MYLNRQETFQFPLSPVVCESFLCVGFGPFGNHSVNASWVAVQELAKTGVSDDVMLIVEEVPVIYEHVQSVVPSLWQKYKPKVNHKLAAESY